MQRLCRRASYNRRGTTDISGRTGRKPGGGYHTFVLRETESGWKIARHMMFDTLYLILWSSEELRRMTDQYIPYAGDNEGYGLLADTSLSYRSGETGDVLVMGTEGNYRHAVMISDIVQEENGKTVDYLVHSNTGNPENYPASLYGYPEVTLIKVLGWNS